MSPRRLVSMLSAVLATVALLTAGPAPVSAAGAPAGSGKVVSVTRAPVPYPTDAFLLQAPAGVDPCGFAVSLQVTQAKRSATTIMTADGTTTVHESGLLQVRLTRVGTEQSIDLDVSGPGTFVTHPDESITQIGFGKQLWAFEPDESHGLPLMTFLTGATTSTFDTSGEFELLTWHGGVMDVCAALSGA